MPVWFFILTLFIVGFILMVIEVILIPGFGAIGVLGLGALGFACYMAFTQLSSIAGTIISLSSVIAVVFLLKIFPKTKIWQKIRLSVSEHKKMGFDVSNPQIDNLMGKEGSALTMLRPSGAIVIDNKRYDAVTSGEFIKKDEKIKVYKIEGANIYVKKIE